MQPFHTISPKQRIWIDPKDACMHEKCMGLCKNLTELIPTIFPLYDYKNFDFDFAYLSFLFPESPLQTRD